MSVVNKWGNVDDMPAYLRLSLDVIKVSLLLTTVCCVSAHVFKASADAAETLHG